MPDSKPTPSHRRPRPAAATVHEYTHRLHAANHAFARLAAEVDQARAARDEAIRDATLAGLSLRQIGSALGLSAEGVRNALPTSAPVYNRIGTTYAQTRRPDPRIQDAIWNALGDARTVVNVGAGAGSYEPPQTILAIEPSMVMVAQRPAGAAPAAITTAERIPLPDQSVDAAMGILTIHHWPDLNAGLRELQRVARRIVIFTWDQAVFRRYWLLADYLPAIAEADDRRAIPIPRLRRILASRGTVTVTPVPVPADCQDGFLGAYWQRPEAYLDPLIRAGISGFTTIDEPTTATGLQRLLADLNTGEWHRKYAHLLDQSELDLGYRLVIADTAG